jgi:hypothetical protein
MFLLLLSSAAAHAIKSPAEYQHVPRCNLLTSNMDSVLSVQSRFKTDDLTFLEQTCDGLYECWGFGVCHNNSHCTYQPGGYLKTLNTADLTDCYLKKSSGTGTSYLAPVPQRDFLLEQISQTEDVALGDCSNSCDANIDCMGFSFSERGKICALMMLQQTATDGTNDAFKTAVYKLARSEEGPEDDAFVSFPRCSLTTDNLMAFDTNSTVELQKLCDTIPHCWAFGVCEPGASCSWQGYLKLLKSTLGFDCFVKLVSKPANGWYGPIANSDAVFTTLSDVANTTLAECKALCDSTCSAFAFEPLSQKCHLKAWLSRAHTHVFFKDTITTDQTLVPEPFCPELCKNNVPRAQPSLPRTGTTCGAWVIWRPCCLPDAIHQAFAYDPDWAPGSRSSLAINSGYYCCGDNEQSGTCMPCGSSTVAADDAPPVVRNLGRVCQDTSSQYKLVLNSDGLPSLNPREQDKTCWFLDPTKGQSLDCAALTKAEQSMVWNQCTNDAAPPYSFTSHNCRHYVQSVMQKYCEILGSTEGPCSC